MVTVLWMTYSQPAKGQKLMRCQHNRINSYVTCILFIIKVSTVISNAFITSKVYRYSNLHAESSTIVIIHLHLVIKSKLGMQEYQ